MFGENTNIINYRYKIENEYSIWQQELETREEAVREKEAQLKLRKQKKHKCNVKIEYIDRYIL